MRLIIDTNIIISSLLKDSKTREILLNESFNFYLPEIVMNEINKHISYIIEKSRLSEEEIKTLLNTLLKNLTLVPIEEYKEKMEKGLKIMGNIDKKDTQFIALALQIKNDGIWSNDKHFDKQKAIKVYKTHEIVDIFDKINQNNISS